jgi:hypothetical protein
MIECSEIKQWLVDYLYGELDARQEPVLTEHLRTCAACRADLAALEKTRATLEAWPAPDAEPAWAFAQNRVPWWSMLQTTWQRNRHRGRRMAFAFGFAGMMLLTTLALFNTRLQYESGHWQLSMSLSKPTMSDLPADAVVMTKRQLYEFEVKHLQFMQSLVAQSESRQQQALHKAIATLAQQTDQKRLQDLQVVSAGLEALQDHTATRLAMTDQILTEFIKANYNEQIQ